MTRYISIFTALLVAVALVTASAQAGTIRSVLVPNGGGTDSQSNLAGTKTNDIYIDAGATEQIGAIQIYAELTEGSFFNHPSGNNSPPSATFVGFVPNLAWDTFAASGQPLNTAFTPLILGSSADLESPNSGGPAIFDNNTIDVTFTPQAGQPTLGLQNFLAARITAGSEGTFRMDVEYTGGVHSTVMGGVIRDSEVLLIPEPATLSLLGLAMLGLAGLCRRR